MYGTGILKGLSVTLKHFFATFADDLKWFGRRNGIESFQVKQGLKGKGMFTVQYPEEKLAPAERFRFLPFLVTYNNDDPEYPGKDWCTSCGICAKVCPPQCIWIVQTKDPTTGRPKPEPEAFYIDIDVCMNCGYCAEYCPFDAIKMDHDYELAAYDRTSNHIYDKPKLSKEMRYWQTIAPTISVQEEAERGGYDHKDVQKLRGKAGMVKSRPGPVSDKPKDVPATAPAPGMAPSPSGIQPEVAAAATAPAAAQVAAADKLQSTPAQTAAAGGTHTADGKPIVRRRGAGAAASTQAATLTTPAAEAAPAAPVVAAPVAAPAPQTAALAAQPDEPRVPSEKAVSTAPTAPESQGDTGAPVTGPAPRDPNKPVTVVRRRNAPPKKD